MSKYEMRILAVDDRQANLTSLKSLLETPHCAIVTAQSGTAALRSLQEEEFTLIILDVQIPDIDGFKIADMARQSDRNADTPIIFLTGHGISGSQQFKGYSLGAVDYLVKPISPDLLKAKVDVFVGLHHKTVLVKKYAREVAESNRKLKRQAKELSLAKEHAEELAHKLEVRQGQLLQAQKMESVGRLAGGVAHDFNNMLSVILGHANLALMDSDPTLPVHSHLAEIRKAAERSADLTRQLLAFARKQTIAPKVLDLNATVGSVLNMLQRLIGENVGLTWCPAQELWPVRMDPSQMDQILTNLCVNARDAISNNGILTIETGNAVLEEDFCADAAGCLPGEYVKLSVSDNGCGMDKGTLALIFEPFFTTKEVGAGTGLGLAMVYGAVKQNGGYVYVYSELGLGTTFTIYLPRFCGMAAPAASKAVGDRAIKRGQETILLVEDEPAILNITAALLERQGYRVLATTSTAEATRLAM